MSENLGENHFYARRITDAVEIHISQAVSGRGYTCLGCGRDMQAVKHKTHITDYFRHDSKYVQQNNKCTFSDHQYRKRIAVEALIFEKKIKTPAIRKFNPLNFDDPPLVLREAEFVYATTVKTNLLFFENAEGVVVMDSELPADGSTLLYKPDVVFIQDEKPVLLVQIVKKFLVSDDDKANLRRLRINTLQITLPHDSREAIFHSLFQSGRSKWIYTNEQQFTKYIRPSSGDIGRSEPIDEFEKRIHTESVTCRLNQIANIVRAINKCYQSEQYREVESRVEGRLRDERRAIEAYRKQRIDLETTIRNELDGKYASELERIRDSEAELEENRKRFSEHHTDLETRYRDQAAKIERDIRAIEDEQSEVARDERKASNTTKDAQFMLARHERTISECIREAELEYSEHLSELSRLADIISGNIEKSHADISTIQQRTSDLPNEFERLEFEARRRSETEIKRINEEEENLPKWVKHEENELTKEFDGLRKRADRDFESRDRSGTSQVSIKLNILLNRRAKLADLEYVGRLIESIKKGTYKNWVR